MILISLTRVQTCAKKMKFIVIVTSHSTITLFYFYSPNLKDLQFSS